MPTSPTPRVTDDNCNGICLSAADIGVGDTQVAYAHPACPAHGEPHPFELTTVDRTGRMICRCRGYQVDHPDQITADLLRLEGTRELAFGYIDQAQGLLRAAKATAVLEAMQHRTATPKGS